MQNIADAATGSVTSAFWISKSSAGRSKRGKETAKEIKTKERDSESEEVSIWK